MPYDGINPAGRPMVKRQLCRKGGGIDMGLTLDNLLTEARNPRTMNLDSMTALEIVTAMNQ